MSFAIENDDKSKQQTEARFILCIEYFKTNKTKIFFT